MSDYVSCLNRIVKINIKSLGSDPGRTAAQRNKEKRGNNSVKVN